MRGHFYLLLVIILVLQACSQAEENKETEKSQDIDDLKGIKLSQWYKSEKYQRDVIDVMNFDTVERTVNVTTVCFGENDERIPTNDSEVLVIPARNKYVWIPVCPENTVSYTIDIDEMD